MGGLTMNELSILLVAVLGAFGTILVGFYKYAQSREEQFTKDRDATAKLMSATIDRLGKHIEAGAAAQKEVAKATAQAAKEAAERNGHLAEIATENKKSNAEQYESILKAVAVITKQGTIKNRTVENETVINQHIENKE